MTPPLLLNSAPAAGFDEPFEMLAACHERVERMLRLLARLQAHLQATGADEAARQAARDVMRYFDLAAPHHHEDEERHVLPALRASGDVTLRALADRLQREHIVMAAAWAALRPGLQSLADAGWSGEPAAGHFARWSAFAELYRGHLDAEDGQAYPAAAARIVDAARRAMGDEMAQRRGVR